MKNIWITCVVASAMLLGCQKETCENQVPAVSVNTVQRSTTTTVVVLNVLDCDGDIGLTQADTGGDFKYNAYIDIRPWQNGKWADKTFDFNDTSVVEIKDENGNVTGYDTIVDLLNYYYRVPFIDNNSRSPVYEAKVELDLGATYFGFDTFRFEARIQDRALNMSDTAYSDTQLGFNR